MRNVCVYIIICLIMASGIKAQDLDWGDFENNVSWWKSWKGTTTVIDNFDFEGNNSSKVLKYEPDSLWQGISIYFEKPPLNPSHMAISLYAYSENSTAIQLGMPSSVATDTFFVKDTLIAGKWRFIEFDISRLKIYSHKYFLIQTVEQTTYYFDNIRVKADPDYTSVIKSNPLNAILYPNPAKEYIRVSGITDHTEVTISSLSGQVLLKKTIMKDNNVSLSSFPVGVYTVELKSGNLNTKTKIIKL